MESCRVVNSEILGQEAWLTSDLDHSQNISARLLSTCDRKMETMILSELQGNTFLKSKFKKYVNCRSTMSHNHKVITETVSQE